MTCLFDVNVLLAIADSHHVFPDPIHRWLNKSGRMTSPKFLLGESYGAFRAPLLARRYTPHS